ncbi:MAG: TVP38/TMEM64 family protein [Omnitrophica bacterium]|nr:TVP38/TMEM64 family protein [Candidatus Omnitrophota bacterium]
MDKKIFKNLIKLFIGILVIAAIWWIVSCQCVNLKVLTPAALRDYIQGFGKLAPIIYILAYSLNTISVLPPIAGLSLAAGLAFGSLWGAIYLMIAALIGTSCTFFISRFFGRGFVERLLKGRFKNLDDLLKRRGFITVLFFRVVPLVPYEVLNYAGGLSKMRFRDYFFASFLGLIPGVIIASFFGGSLGEVRGLQDLFSLKFILASLALVLIIAVPFLYQYIKNRFKL